MSEILIKKPTYAQLLQENSKLKKELDELKQKLQQLWNEKPTIPEIMLTTKRQSLKDFISEEIDWRIKLHKLFEELLKEEKAK